ncbi:class I SAM-dependent methyltransferase [Pseudonocardia sp.]|uniref:class I SAM-dependent methyltransferase n=1 Tax=Pseudonocardia sp. TaxID=60912 RepID=UPI0031FD916A
MSSRRLAASFRHAGVAAAYAYRPPYPAELFDTLEELIVDELRAVLDIGAGDGALARPLAERVDRVDAVEISAAMVDAGRRRPGGQRSNLVWLVEPAERMTACGPYGLVTAGASLHWMDPTTTLDRIDRLLAPSAVLAVVDQRYHQLPWQDALIEVIVAHTRNSTYDPGFSLPDALAKQGLFDIHGRSETGPVTFTQPVRDYIEQFHSTASLARELMSADEATRFDDKVAAVVREYEQDGQLSFPITASVVWGRPIERACNNVSSTILLTRGTTYSQQWQSGCKAGFTASRQDDGLMPG